jgi:hypothetical protein
MHLIEAEAVGPVEGDAPLVTPPRPPHRRVSVSLLFTLTVLTGTVVAIYMTFPARNNVLVTEAIAHHRNATPAWDLTAPSSPEVRAWLMGIAGRDVPMPENAGAISGARRIEILNREAAVMRLTIGTDEITYLVQRARGLPPSGADRRSGELRAIAWKRGPYALVAVGPDATADRWTTAFR